MSQSRTLSLAEAVANIAVGYGLAVLAQIVVFPVFGIDVTIPDAAQIGLVFTALSLARGYALRRLFERLARPPE